MAASCTSSRADQDIESATRRVELWRASTREVNSAEGCGFNFDPYKRSAPVLTHATPNPLNHEIDPRGTSPEHTHSVGHPSIELTVSDTQCERARPCTHSSSDGLTKHFGRSSSDGLDSRFHPPGGGILVPMGPQDHLHPYRGHPVRPDAVARSSARRGAGVDAIRHLIGLAVSRRIEEMMTGRRTCMVAVSMDRAPRRQGNTSDPGDRRSRRRRDRLARLLRWYAPPPRLVSAWWDTKVLLLDEPHRLDPEAHRAVDAIRGWQRRHRHPAHHPALDEADQLAPPS